MTIARRRIAVMVIALLVAVAGLISSGSPARAASAEVTRWAGHDRYATSSTISAQSFPGGAPVAFLTNGLEFSDALSGAPAATRLGGPVLLTQVAGLPTPVADELRRLAPAKVIILGGEASVSTAVEDEVRALISTEIVRWSGPDRYATSAVISAESFPVASPVAFVASGLVFADALAGAPVAGQLGGPVLLTQPDALPGATMEELRRLAPAKIVILGGAASVSEQVRSQLAALTTGEVSRWSGADRYSTAIAISTEAFPTGAPIAFVANGLIFADALAGAPAAGTLGGPVLLTQAGGLPTPVADELRRLKPSKIVILGGEASVSATVRDQVAFLSSDFPQASGGRLTRATEVRAGTCLASPDASHQLCVGTDGRFGIYRGTTPLWTSGAADATVRSLRIRDDGNAVLFGVDGRVIWESSTAGTDASELLVQNDGDLMLTAPGGAIVWSSMSSATAPRWRLPFASGQSWAAGAPHANSGGTVGARGSLDFGPQTGADRRVLAIADGTVYRVQCGSASYLGINHANGWQSTYYHLVNYQDQLVGQFVTAGTYLGDVGRTVPCGGGATFDHVHLTIRRAGVPVSVEGMRFGGYTVRSSGQDYWGFWTTSNEVRVLTAQGGAACCLTAP
ncbi:Putative cell wall-binding protein [Microbacterium sp. cf046]|uniref:cell wall-binding repeat-containing protein n=1 Tax=Microbacterium sp. cf046 TaxID=1761803 RepID=UPI0008F0AC2A|nr:cell wall-binding repeat-containing protein [Microbacterium sp. cf046]SFS04689.1 Putative cell wall-binding protein [Microbacterium sp. cf046]